MTRICTLVERFPPMVGGAEIQAKQLSVALAGCGVSVIVITRRITPQLSEQETSDGLTIYRVPPSGRRSHGLNILSVFTFTWALFHHRREYDILHVHDMFSLLLAAIVVRILIHKPLVVKVPTYGNVSRHGSQMTPTSVYSRILHHVILPRRLWLWLLNRVDTFIAISNEIENELRSANLGHKTLRMTNAVDTSRFRPANPQEKRALRQRLDLPTDTTVIVSHGRIVRRKRLDVLIHAVARVCQTHPDLYVALPGPFVPVDPALETNLQSLIARYGLEQKICFVGQSATPEDYLRAADVFVIPSEREGMPNALLEAMACGLPCCASAIGGITDVLKHGENGLLFSAGDVPSLAHLMSQIVAKPDVASRLGTAALETIRAFYTWDAIIDKYTDLYQHLLNNNLARE